MRITHWGELPQFYPGVPEDLGCVRVHAVTLTIHYFRDTHLHNLDTTSQTWTCIAVQNASIANPLPASLQQGIFFCVEAKTGRQRCTTAFARVAPRTPALSTVQQMPWRSVVAGANDVMLRVHQHASHGTFHAIAPMRRQGC